MRITLKLTFKNNLPSHKNILQLHVRSSVVFNNNVFFSLQEVAATIDFTAVLRTIRLCCDVSKVNFIFCLLSLEYNNQEAQYILANALPVFK